MLKLINLRIILSCVIVATLFSCEKQYTTTADTSKEDFLTFKPWLLNTLLTKKRVDSPWRVDTDFIKKPCRLDNIYTYFRNKSYTETEGKLKCDTTPSAPDLLQQCNWSLQNGGKLLIRSNVFGSEKYTIEELNIFTLQLYYMEDNGVDTNFYRATYNH